MARALDYIHLIAEEIGEFATGVTSSVGTTSSLVCDAFTNSNLESTELAEYAVLVESGAAVGELGWIKRAGLAKASGTISTADAFSAAIASGVSFSIYGRLPAYRKGLVPGLLQIVNRALGRLWVESTVVLDGVTDLEHYSIDMAAYPWFTDETRIIDVLLPVNNADDVPRILPRTSWDWRTNGETRQLVFRGSPFRTGDDVAIKVYRPANSRLKLNATARATLSTDTVGSVTVVNGGYYTAAPAVTFSGGGGSGAAATAVMSVTPGPVTSITVTNAGSGYTTVPTVSIAAGSWADQTSATAGLVGITDEAISDAHDVFVLGVALAYRALASMTVPNDHVAEWLAKANAWSTIAARLKANRVPTDRRTGLARLRPVVTAGGRAILSWSGRG